MLIDVRNRRMGKTTNAVNLANSTGAYLVVANSAIAKQIAKEHKPDRYPITIHELLSDKMRGSNIKNIVIDNLDLMLPVIFPGLKVEAITLTDEDLK